MKSLFKDHFYIITIPQIYDGDSVNATMQRDICLTFHPPAIVSTGHALTFVVTNTNQNDNKPNRFEARYSVMDNCMFEAADSFDLS